MIDCRYEGELEIGKRIKTFGVDWGPKGIILIFRRDNFVLLKIPGHNTWAGVGMGQYYAETIYNIAELVEATRTAPYGPAPEIEIVTRLKFKLTGQREPGHKWRTVVKEMKAEVIAFAEESHNGDE